MQHDLVVDNGPGLTVRQDFIAAIQASASQQLGANPPTVTYPCQFWCKQTTGEVFMRNKANTAWILVGILDDATGTFGAPEAERKLTRPADPATLLATDRYVMIFNSGAPLMLTPPVTPRPNQRIILIDALGTAGLFPIGLTGSVWCGDTAATPNPQLIMVGGASCELLFSEGGIYRIM